MTNMDIMKFSSSQIHSDYTAYLYTPMVLVGLTLFISFVGYVVVIILKAQLEQHMVLIRKIQMDNAEFQKTITERVDKNYRKYLENIDIIEERLALIQNVMKESEIEIQTKHNETNDKLNNRMEEFETELTRCIENWIVAKDEIESLKTELQTKVEELKTEVQKENKELDDLKTELQIKVEEIKTEVQKENKELDNLKTEMSENNSKIQGNMEDLNKNLSMQLDELNLHQQQDRVEINTQLRNISDGFTIIPYGSGFINMDVEEILFYATFIDGTRSFDIKIHEGNSHSQNIILNSMKLYYNDKTNANYVIHFMKQFKKIKCIHFDIDNAFLSINQLI
jgi:hypothetical protein